MNTQFLKYGTAILSLILLLAIIGCQPGSKEQAPTNPQPTVTSKPNTPQPTVTSTPTTPQPTVTSTPTGTFTGRIIFTYEIEDFEPFYLWAEEGVHYRNVAAYWDADFSDDRLDGAWLCMGNFDGDKRSTNKNWTWGNAWGTWLVLGESEELPVRWDGAYTAVTDENGKSHSESTLYGVGQNKGLTAKMTCEYEYIGEPHSISEIECQGAMYEEE